MTYLTVLVGAPAVVLVALGAALLLLSRRIESRRRAETDVLVDETARHLRDHTADAYGPSSVRR